MGEKVLTGECIQRLNDRFFFFHFFYLPIEILKSEINYYESSGMRVCCVNWGEEEAHNDQMGCTSYAGTNR